MRSYLSKPNCLYKQGFIDLSFILHAVKCHAASRPRKVPANPTTTDVTKNRFSNMPTNSEAPYKWIVNNAAYNFDSSTASVYKRHLPMPIMK